jgi:hypothetical protein
MAVFYIFLLNNLQTILLVVILIYLIRIYNKLK